MSFSHPKAGQEILFLINWGAAVNMFSKKIK